MAHAVVDDPEYHFRNVRLTKPIVLCDFVRKGTGAPVELRFEATVGSDRIFFNDKWNSHALVVAFHEADGTALQELDRRVWEDHLCDRHGNPMENEELSEWVHKPFFKEEGSYDYFLKLKTEKGGKKFRFHANIPLTPHKESKDLYMGQGVTIRGKVSLWYNTEKKEAGLTLTATELFFPIRPRMMELDDEESRGTHVDEEPAAHTPAPTPSKRKQQPRRPSMSPMLSLPPPTVRHEGNHHVAGHPPASRKRKD
jgi:hypothetical protein